MPRFDENGGDHSINFSRRVLGSDIRMMLFIFLGMGKLHWRYSCWSW